MIILEMYHGSLFPKCLGSLMMLAMVSGHADYSMLVSVGQRMPTYVFRENMGNIILGKLFMAFAFILRYTDCKTSVIQRSLI